LEGGNASSAGAGASLVNAFNDERDEVGSTSSHPDQDPISSARTYQLRATNVDEEPIEDVGRANSQSVVEGQHQ